MASRTDTIKWVPSTSFRVDGFRTHRGTCTAYFLTHAHSDHTWGLTRGFSRAPIICSPVTAQLMAYDFKLKNTQLLYVMEENTWYTMDNVPVIAIDANHCPGSIMFLFILPDDQAGLNTGKRRRSGYEHGECSTKAKLQQNDVARKGDMGAAPVWDWKGAARAAHQKAGNRFRAGPALPPNVVHGNARFKRALPADVALYNQLITQQSPLKLLHVGDFRWDSRVMNIKPVLSTCKLNVLYLDTTYAASRFNFPPQDTVILSLIQQARALRQRFPAQRTVFVVGSYHIGKERAVFGLARGLGCRVFATPDKKRVLRLLNLPRAWMDMLHPDSTKCDVHVGVHVSNFESLEAYRHEIGVPVVVGVRATGWTYTKKHGGIARVVRSNLDGTAHMLTCPYSEHSAWCELQECVKFLQPQQIIPTVSAESAEAQRRVVDKLANCTKLTRDKGRLHSYFSALKTPKNTIKQASTPENPRKLSPETPVNTVNPWRTQSTPLQHLSITQCSGGTRQGQSALRDGRGDPNSGVSVGGGAGEGGGIKCEGGVKCESGIKCEGGQSEGEQKEWEDLQLDDLDLWCDQPDYEQYDEQLWCDEGGVGMSSQQVYDERIVQLLSQDNVASGADSEQNIPENNNNNNNNNEQVTLDEFNQSSSCQSQDSSEFQQQDGLQGPLGSLPAVNGHKRAERPAPLEATQDDVAWCMDSEFEIGSTGLINGEKNIPQSCIPLQKPRMVATGANWVGGLGNEDQIDRSRQRSEGEPACTVEGVGCKENARDYGSWQDNRGSCGQEVKQMTRGTTVCVGYEHGEQWQHCASTGVAQHGQHGQHALADLQRCGGVDGLDGQQHARANDCLGGGNCVRDQGSAQQQSPKFGGLTDHHNQVGAHNCDNVTKQGILINPPQEPEFAAHEETTRYPSNHARNGARGRVESTGTRVPDLAQAKSKDGTRNRYTPAAAPACDQQRDDVENQQSVVRGTTHVEVNAWADIVTVGLTEKCDRDTHDMDIMSTDVKQQQRLLDLYAIRQRNKQFSSRNQPRGVTPAKQSQIKLSGGKLVGVKQQASSEGARRKRAGS